MMAEIKAGDRVRFHLEGKSGAPEGWYPGTVFRIDPYSAHRAFYWIKLDLSAQQQLGITQISVFNPKNIELINRAA
jgi:hypothetical protein